MSQLTFCAHSRQEVQSENQVASASRIGQDYCCHILADGRPSSFAYDVLVCEVQAQRSSLANSAIWEVLDASLLNNYHYKVRIKDKVEQSREWSSTFM